MRSATSPMGLPVPVIGMPMTPEGPSPVKALDLGARPLMIASAMTRASSLHAAALAGDAAGVAAALTAGGTIDARTAAGETALMLAAQRGDAASVALLLERGALVDAATPQGNTALMMAAARGQGAVVAALVAGGAVAGHVNRYGLGARDWARWAADPEAILRGLDGT
ncbi:MAG: ankyrin repeat domain-containing protein [Alphaproteobacteria bacterium]|nr:ankyrin repeat domain-containing protein [Alphaproteobacteria bacterium]